MTTCSAIKIVRGVLLPASMLLTLLALSITAEAQVDSLRQEMRRGNPSGMEEYIDGLSRSQRRSFDNRVLLTEMGLCHYDLEEAEAQLEGLRSLRRLTEEQTDRIDRLEQEIEMVKRFTRQPATMQLYDVSRGTEEELVANLNVEQAGQTGEIRRGSFVSADGRELWQVVSDTTGTDALRLTLRLGDGSWDETGAMEIELLGLEGGRIAYPHLMADGETICFAYAGPESLGGYDLFVSRFDREGARLLVPQQLGAPFNTTADDLLLLEDPEWGVDRLLTNRGTAHPDTLTLYALSHDRRHDEPVTAERCWLLGDSILATATALPDRPTRSVSASAEEKHRPLFRIGKRPVYDAESVTNREAQFFLREYLMHHERLEVVTNQLEDLRKRYADDRSLGEKILQLETEEQMLRESLFDLRNKVIRLEQPEES